MSHIILAVAAQLLFGLLFRRWLLGGLLLTFFYIGREITQAEYRWISSFGDGQRANMPWWGGLDPNAWTLKSVGDVLLPAIAVLVVYAIVRIVARRS